MAYRSVAEQAQRLLEAHLLDGSWPAGMRLPSERALAQELHVSRNSLREAIFSLKGRGLLISRPGSGIFVSDLLQASIASPWRQLVADHPDLRSDTLEFRRELEGATAYFAAIRANATDLKKLEAIVKRLLRAYESADSERTEEHRADADFHQAIAEASHNTMFLYLHSSLLRILREHISLNLIGLESHTRRIADQLRQQHLNIWNAVRNHHPEAAREAMIAHIDFTWAELTRRERRHAGVSSGPFVGGRESARGRIGSAEGTTPKKRLRR
jgi:GntR family transcriptional repressor for pyruvate dehydrogenase complex